PRARWFWSAARIRTPSSPPSKQPLPPKRCFHPARSFAAAGCFFVVKYGILLPVSPTSKGRSSYESNHHHSQHQRQRLAERFHRVVYAQTEQDFHLIVVDNGSTDESLAEARSYCGRPDFTLIENGE